MPQTHYRACNLCEAVCGLAIGQPLTAGRPEQPLHPLAL
jgi:hypothetical protein